MARDHALLRRLRREQTDVEARLAVEVDGAHHLEPDQVAHDAERTAWLEARGARVVRFLDTEVLLETDAVVQRIADLLAELANPLTPALSPAAGERGPDSSDVTE